MKQIRITCWFLDSEEFLAKLVISEGYKIIIRKIIDPIAIVTGRLQSMVPEKYDIYGKDEEINKFEEFINSSDFDIEIAKKEDP